MNKSILSGLLACSLLFGLNSFAGDNSPFSFNTMEAEFNQAPAPTASQLEGKWIRVGIVNQMMSHQDQNGYWPDGKLPNYKNPGHAYYDVFEFSAVEKAPRLLVLNETGVDIVSGAILKKIEPSETLSQTETGFQYIPHVNPYMCATSTECRIVKETGMLLCAWTPIGPNQYGNPCEIWSIRPQI